MKRVNIPVLNIVVGVLLIALFFVALLTPAFVKKPKPKPVVHDAPAVSVARNTEYYVDALIADRAVIPGLPGMEEIAEAGRKDDLQKVAEFWIQAANAYAAFASQTKDKSQSSSSYEKYAFFTYLAGTLYEDFLHDKERACWCFGGALSADQSNSIYRKSYDSPACQAYRNKQ
ncbi:MAG: hypothetical protein HYT94_01165 [Parcubacteria group bacterium]|nr:hypothetical protein [Parcubacteria group bacterium]